MSETLTAKREGVVAVLPGTVEEAQFEQIYCPGCQHARELAEQVAKLKFRADEHDGRFVAVEHFARETDDEVEDLVARVAELEAAHKRLVEYVKFRAELAP